MSRYVDDEAFNSDLDSDGGGNMSETKSDRDFIDNSNDEPPPKRPRFDQMFEDDDGFDDDMDSMIRAAEEYEAEQQFFDDQQDIEEYEQLSQQQQPSQPQQRHTAEEWDQFAQRGMQMNREMSQEPQYYQPPDPSTMYEERVNPYDQLPPQRQRQPPPPQQRAPPPRQQQPRQQPPPQQRRYYPPEPQAPALPPVDPQANNDDLEWPDFTRQPPDTVLIDANEYRSLLESARLDQLEAVIMDLLCHLHPFGQGELDLVPGGDVPEEVQNITLIHFLQMAQRLFPLDVDINRLEQIMDNYRQRFEHLQMTYRCRLQALNRNLRGVEAVKFNRGMSIAAARLCQCYEVAKHNNMFNETFNSHYDHELSPYDTFTIMEDDHEELGIFQNMVVVVLKHAWERHYRKRGDTIYKRKHVDSKFVHFYEKFKTIKDYVYSFASEVMIGSHWYAFTQKPEYVEKVIKHLENGSHTFLPDLENDRLYFAFKNGVYSLEDRVFKPHDEVLSSVIAVNYFDIDVDWDAIKDHLNTPFFKFNIDPRPSQDGSYTEEQVLRRLEVPEYDWLRVPGETAMTKMIETQWKEPSDDVPIECHVEHADIVHRLFWAMIGRLFWELNVKDTFQRQGQLFGESGTGKSAIINIISQFYPPDFFELMSSGMESKYATAKLEDVLLYVFDEASEQFGIHESDYLQTITGGWIVRREKFKTHGKFRMKAPGILTANKFVNFKHYRAAVARRMWAFIMKYKIPPHLIDGTLEELAKMQMPVIIMKANHAYLELVNIMAERGLSDLSAFWPKYFDNIVQQFMYAKEPMMHWFYTCDNLKFSMDNPEQLGLQIVCPYDTLRRDFIEWAKKNGVRNPEWSEETFTSMFPQKKVAFLTRKKTASGHWTHGTTITRPGKIQHDYRGRTMTAVFVTGVDVYREPRVSDEEAKESGAFQPNFGQQQQQQEEPAQYINFDSYPRQPVALPPDEDDKWLTQTEDEVVLPEQSYDDFMAAMREFRQDYDQNSLYVADRRKNFVRKKLIPNMEALITFAVPDEDDEIGVVLEDEKINNLKRLVRKLKACVRE
jgi:phage/plasmid-associated DNA primase